MDGEGEEVTKEEGKLEVGGGGGKGGRRAGK